MDMKSINLQENSDFAQKALESRAFGYRYPHSLAPGGPPPSATTPTSSASNPVASLCLLCQQANPHYRQSFLARTTAKPPNWYPGLYSSPLLNSYPHCSPSDLSKTHLMLTLPGQTTSRWFIITYRRKHESPRLKEQKVPEQSLWARQGDTGMDTASEHSSLALCKTVKPKYFCSLTNNSLPRLILQIPFHMQMDLCTGYSLRRSLQ